MLKPQATNTLVFQAAEELTTNNKTPTIKAVRELLGCGSNTTIHKYLTLWKQEQIQKQEATTKKTANSAATELKDLKLQLKLQQKNNQQLAKEVFDLECKLNTTEQAVLELQQQLSQQNSAYKQTSERLNSAEQLAKTMQAERDSNLAQVLVAQQKLITQFQEDLKQINQASLDKVSEISIKNQDAWLEEKVKNKVLENTNLELKAAVSQLEKSLQEEKERNQPLRKKIATLEAIIAKHVDLGALVAKTSNVEAE